MQMYELPINGNVHKYIIYVETPRHPFHHSPIKFPLTFISNN